jgi:3-oxoacyl-[acyl-carrier protein] reductase
LDFVIARMNGFGFTSTMLLNGNKERTGKAILEYNMEDIDRVLAINVKGYIYFSQAFGKLIIQSKRRGGIINVSSVSGIEGSSDAVYGCSKAAISMG